MNNNYYIRKSIIFIISIILILLFVNGIYASAEFLKINTQIKYQELIKCIKAHNNDVSKCIDEYKIYIKNEIKLIKSTSNNDKYSIRLSKMITYLKKSTDLFHNKAKKNNNLIYWEKAAKCANLLANISKKYVNYKNIVKNYNNAKRGPSLSIHLKQKKKELEQYNYPSAEYLEALEKYVNKINDNIGVLKKESIIQLTKVGEQVVNDNIYYFKDILESTKKHDLTTYNQVKIRYKIFKAAVNLKNINEENLVELKAIIKSTTEAFNNFTKYTLKIINHNDQYYLNDEYEKFVSNSKVVIHILPKYIKTYKNINRQDKLYTGINKLTVAELNTLILLEDFYRNVYDAYNYKIKQKYIRSVHKYKSAMEQINNNEKLYIKTKKNYEKALNAKFYEIVKNYKASIDNQNYLWALNILNVNLQFSKKQKITINQYKRKAINHYATNFINKVKKLEHDQNYGSFLRCVEKLKVEYFFKKEKERIYQALIQAVKYFADNTKFDEAKEIIEKIKTIKLTENKIDKIKILKESIQQAQTNYLLEKYISQAKSYYAEMDYAKAYNTLKINLPLNDEQIQKVSMLKEKIIIVGKEKNINYIEKLKNELMEKCRSQGFINCMKNTCSNLRLPFNVTIIDKKEKCKNIQNYIRNEWKKFVNLGKVNISSINEAIILLDASDDDEFTHKPLVENQKGYFVWSGTLKTKKFNTFIVWDVVENIFYDGYVFDEPFIKSGFAFINIIKKFDNLQYDSHVTVVGEYVDNTEITLVTGETVSLPVLSNCYVK